MMAHEILPDGIAVVSPTGPVSEDDFTNLAEAVDTYLESHDSMKGILIHTKDFPGWEGLSGIINHLKFVRDHHKVIERIALVTDSKLATLSPVLTNHFVAAEVKAFDFESFEEALDWLRPD